MIDHLNPPNGSPKNKGGRPRKWKQNPVTGKPMRGTPIDDLVPPKGTEARLSPYREFAFEKPEVALYIARVVIGCEMDYDKAVAYLRKYMPVEERLELSVKIENDPYVQNAIKHLLKSVGIDDASRDQFIKQIWAWFYGDDSDKALAASRVLTRVFFGEQRQSESVDELKIEGFKEGLDKMLGGKKEPEPAQVGSEVIQTNALYIMPGKEE